MLLWTGLLLGMVGAIIEIMVYQRVPIVRKSIHKIPVLGILGSLCLTLLIGHLFGAVGLTALLGGTLTCALTQPYYWAETKGFRIRSVWQSIKARFTRTPALATA